MPRIHLQMARAVPNKKNRKEMKSRKNALPRVLDSWHRPCGQLSERGDVQAVQSGGGCSVRFRGESQAGRPQMLRAGGQVGR